jgi:DNA-binding SARP family transcriptional activator
VSTLRVKLFGKFAVRVGETSIRLWGKPAELLALLALSVGTAFPRERLAGTLWPDISERRARANLSTSFWRLRQALGADADRWFVTTPVSLALDSATCSVDVAEFRKGIRDLGAGYISAPLFPLWCVVCNYTRAICWRIGTLTGV